MHKLQCFSENKFHPTLFEALYTLERYYIASLTGSKIASSKQAFRMQMGVIFQPDCLDDLFIFLCCRRTSEVFYFATCCAFSGREIASKSSLIISLRH